MNIPIDSQHRRIRVTLRIKVEKATTIVVLGKDVQRPNSIYIARSVHFDLSNTTKEINIPFPLTPGQLLLQLKDQHASKNQHFKVEDIQITLLEPKAIWEYPDIHNFIPFADWFVKQAGELPTGTYQSKGEHYRIEYHSTIKDPSGTPLTTPARTSRNNGLIQVSKAHFLKYSIPIRWFILMHERKHFQIPTRSEKEADLGALRVFLDYGFPKIEAIYACTKAMEAYTPLALKAKTERLKDIHRFIGHYHN